MRSAFAPVALSFAALLAALARWAIQGSGNLYTAIDKRFYVPDPDVGWIESADHPIWLGLEVCAMLAGVAVAVAGAGWWIRRRERATADRARLLRGASWVIGVAPWIVPIAAFTSGGRPAGGVSLLPTAVTTVDAPGIAGALPLPAGRYEVVAHPASLISARLSAGGEAFDAKLAGDLRGAWEGDPRRLDAPMAAEVSVAAASVDTGIGERSKHAREGYLKADKFPRITFVLERLLAAHQDGPAQIAFRAAGTVGLMGRTHHVEVTGTLRQLDAAAQRRLAVTGDVMLVQADFSLTIADTALAPDAGDFDGESFPIHVSLVVRHTGGPSVPGAGAS